MVFSSVPFLYFFLPPLLLLYFISPEKLRNTVLLIFSLIFYAAGEPRYIYLMLLSILSAYIFALIIDKVKKYRRLLLFLSVGISALPLLYYKYSVFFIENVNSIFGLSVTAPKLTLPIGISFYTFQLISYICDVYRKRVPAQKNYFSLALYVSFFPQLIAGPIVRYSDINEALQHRTSSYENFSSGAFRFTIGLAKKILLANNLGELCAVYKDISNPTMLFTWIYGAAICCQIYFDFSGYSDMAIGLGKIFGFNFPENFNYPFMSSGAAEFWRRWHISLGSWFRDYVYIPMGGNRVSVPRWMFNILTVWFLTGFWHGAGWVFISWGLYFAVFLVLEKFLKKYIDTLPSFIKHIGTLFIVMVSFILFDSASLSDFFATFMRLFSFSNISSPDTLYYLRSYAVMLIISIIGCTDYPKRAALKLSSAKSTFFQTAAGIAAPVLMCTLLIVSTAYLVDGSFNPFLYFRF